MCLLHTKKRDVKISRQMVCIFYSATIDPISPPLLMHKEKEPFLTPHTVECVVSSPFLVMESACLLLQAVGRALLDRRHMGLRHFHRLRQASRYRRMYIDPYSQRMLQVLQAVGRGWLSRKSLAPRRCSNSKGSRLLVRAGGGNVMLRPRRRLVPIGYRPPQSESERATRLSVLESLTFFLRVKIVQRWWRRVLARRQQAHRELVMARLAVFNAMAVLIQRWWRAFLLQIRFVAPSAAELRHSSFAIVTAQDLRLQRNDQRATLLKRWQDAVSHDKPPRAGRVRPWKPAPRRAVLNPLAVSGRYVPNLSAAHVAGKSEWNDSSALKSKLWYCEPRK